MRGVVELGAFWKYLLRKNKNIDLSIAHCFYTLGKLGKMLYVSKKNPIFFIKMGEKIAHFEKKNRKILGNIQHFAMIIPSAPRHKLKLILTTEPSGPSFLL